MDEKIKFPSNVVLIDAAFLNLVVTDLKKYFEKTLMRELQEIDLSELVTYIVLDAGMAVGDNQIQIRLRCRFRTIAMLLRMSMASLGR